MMFSGSWNTLLDKLDDLPEKATLITPLSHRRFRVTDVQEQRVIIGFVDRDETRPLQREQFETLYRRITDEPDGFELDRLPADADPYPAVLSLHPQFEIDEDEGVITAQDGRTTSQLLDGELAGDSDERSEPDLDVYADALLLVDALERHNVTTLSEMETDALVNLYTLLSDVQRNANDFRQDVAGVLLNRLHHDRPVSSPFGSVQRTTRRNRSLKNEDEVLSKLEDAGIGRERVTGVDRSKVDDALEVTRLSETDVYDIDEQSTSARPISTRRSRRPDSKASRNSSRRRRVKTPRNYARRSRTSMDASTSSSRNSSSGVWISKRKEPNRHR